MPCWVNFQLWKLGEDLSVMAQDWHGGCSGGRELSECLLEGTVTHLKGTQIWLQEPRTNRDSYWNLSWGSSRRENYTAKRRRKPGSFCSSFSTQKLHYSTVLFPALFSVFQKFWWLLSLNFCVTLFFATFFSELTDLFIASSTVFFRQCNKHTGS